jgi:hypothetical protein
MAPAKSVAARGKGLGTEGGRALKALSSGSSRVIDEEDEGVAEFGTFASPAAVFVV